MIGQGEEFKEKRLIWLHGGAGAGKSAIMQSIVERCIRRHVVILGSFFFSRIDSSRNYAEVLIPTLAYQVAHTFPSAISILELVINHNPLIFKASLHTQAYELLVQPMLHLINIEEISVDSPLRKVFVVDGLDECSDPKKQALIIRVIASVLCDHNIPISFLIASRPEVAITSAFEREKNMHTMFGTITLEDDADARSDIRQFIEDSFLDILESHPHRMHIKLPWPGARVIDDLVSRSSGHFVFAATTMKFIASSDKHPGHALKVVYGLAPSRTGSPNSDLDALYTHILTHARYRSQVLTILAHCYYTALSCSVAAVSYIHKMSPEDVVLFLSDVQSLISLTPDSTAELMITPRHATLFEFFISKPRSGALYHDIQDYKPSLSRYFELVDSGPQPSMTTFSFQEIDTHHLMYALTSAILQSRDKLLAMSLIYWHSPYNIWNFCIESSALDPKSTTGMVRELIAMSMNEYMRGVRGFSVSNALPRI